jgi:deoxyribose-phosphate aldolase
MENILHLLSMYSLAGAEGVADHDARAASVPPTRDDIALCLSCMDYTSLESTDTAASITAKLATLRDRLWRYALPEVAAACVLPRFAGEARRALAGSAIRTAVVAGGFPTGGTIP